MKNRLISAAIYLVMGFAVVLIVHIVLGMIFHREGGLIDWMTVLVATALLMVLNIRAIGRTAARIESDGICAALRALFVDDSRKK